VREVVTIVYIIHNRAGPFVTQATQLNYSMTTTIDGDELETEFEAVGSEFDRFTHVIVCDTEGKFVEAVPYVYIRTIARIQQTLTIVPKAQYPDLNQYAVRDELLQLASTNPAFISSLAKQRHEIIPTLHQQMRGLQELGMLDETSAQPLIGQLVAFLTTIRVGQLNGEGIFWLPENYLGDTDRDGPDANEAEDYEEGIRREICAHIKYRRLPMVHLLPMDPVHSTMLMNLIETLTEYARSDLTRKAQQTHFAPLFRNSHIGAEGLKVLMAEEFRCVKNEEVIDATNSFIFNQEQMGHLHDFLDAEAYRDRLQYYVGDYLNDLDLSRSFITGSAMTAALHIRTHDNPELGIDLFYPKVLTELPAEVLEDLRVDNLTLWNIAAVSLTEGVMTKGDECIPFSIKPGSDVDLAVDNTVTDDEYRAIAQGHFEVIGRYYPYVKMRQHDKPKGDWNYIIYTDDPAYVPVFRTVEIYRSSFRNICSHHVGAVRGCFTARWAPKVEGQPPKAQFYLTASAMWTFRHYATPNYHYFAGRKSNPQDIIIKNLMRGIHISDEVLNEIVRRYKNRKNIVIDDLPFYFCRNVPYSIFAAPLEYAMAQPRLQTAIEDRAQRRAREADQRAREARQQAKQQAKEREQQQREAEREMFLAMTRNPAQAVPLPTLTGYLGAHEQTAQALVRSPLVFVANNIPCMPGYEAPIPAEQHLAKTRGQMNTARATAIPRVVVDARIPAIPRVPMPPPTTIPQIPVPIGLPQMPRAVPRTIIPLIQWDEVPAPGQSPGPQLPRILL
jgi:hypothetical protein